MVKFDCPHCGKTEHEFTQEKGEYNEIYQVRCLVCNVAHDVPRHSWLHAEHILADALKPSRAYLTKFPHIEPHTGVMVTSAEHRRETMKRMGMHEAPHGIDTRYDDERCDDLRSRRQESEKRKRELKDRIKYSLR